MDALEEVEERIDIPRRRLRIRYSNEYGTRNTEKRLTPKRTPMPVKIGIAGEND
jgi:hypothetical protein